MTRSGEVRVICTDRGAHGSRELAAVIRAAPGDQAVMGGAAPPLILIAERKGRSGVGAPGVTTRHASVYRGGAEPVWRFQCPTCGRDFQRRESALTVIVDALLMRAPGAVLDLSALPANI